MYEKIDFVPIFAVPEPSEEPENGENEDEGGQKGKGSILKLTKAERRAKLKKEKKEAKKQCKELSSQPEVVQETPQTAVLVLTPRSISVHLRKKLKSQKSLTEFQRGQLLEGRCSWWWH